MNNEFKKLTPFKMQVLQSFPFIDEDFDAITNYELLCKVVEYLNTTVNNVDLLNDEVNEFKTYFDNLDVQEEIDKKLDEMAISGELTLLIKKYIDPIYQSYEEEINSTINNQNDNINNFENNINNRVNNLNDVVSSVAGGSPKGVYATLTDLQTDNPSHDYIYVVSATGKWYYYDTTLSAWSEGGTYQATEIADGSVSYNKLESELRNSFTISTSIINKEAVLKQYINSSGAVANNNYTGYISIDVSYLDTYKISCPYSLATFGSNEPVYMFKNNGSVVSYVKGSEVTLTDGYFNTILEIPSGVDELIINYLYGNNINNRLTVTKVNKYIINNINKNQLSSELQSFLENTYETVTPTLFVQNALLGTNDVAPLNGYSVYSLDVNPGEVYKISGKQIYTNPFVAFGNANAQITYTISGNEYVFQCINGKILGSSGETYSNYVFTIPENINKIYLNKQSGQDLALSKCNGYKVKVDDIDLTSINPLDNKTIMFVGDSVTAATTSGVKGWATLIHENNPTAYVYNYGVDGATLSVNEHTGNNNVINKLQTMYSEHPNADYIIIQGGINDAWLPSYVPMGTFSKDTNFNNDPNYDTSTFCGALEYIFNYCLNNFGGKKVGFIVSPQMAGISNFREYMDKAKEICNKWSIPYVDLFNEGDLNFHITSQRQNYSITTVTPTGDGTHPNLAGYQIITPKIENWMKYKI